MLNKIDAAKYIGISVRTLENYMSDGRAVAIYEKAAKSRPVAMFTETECERLKSIVDKSRQITATVNADVPASSPQVVRGKESSVSAISSVKSAGFPQEVPANYYGLSGTDLAALIEMAGQGRTVQVAIKDKPVLTFSEAALLTGFSERTLRSASKEGVTNRLHCKRIGKADRILRDDLDIWIKAEMKS